MSKIWFTSDLHFGHQKIVEYTNRGVFTSQDTHDRDVIDLWNSQVSKNDIVYQLGGTLFSTAAILKFGNQLFPNSTDESFISKGTMIVLMF